MITQLPVAQCLARETRVGGDELGIELDRDAVKLNNARAAFGAASIEASMFGTQEIVVSFEVGSAALGNLFLRRRHSQVLLGVGL